MNYVIVTEEGQILDFNSYDVLWLTDEQIVELESEVPSEYVFDAAIGYHEQNFSEIISKMES